MEPEQLLQEYIKLRMAKNEKALDRGLSRDRMRNTLQAYKTRADADKVVAGYRASASKYKDDVDLMKKMVEVQADQDKARLGAFVDLATQINKFYDLNPTQKYYLDDDKQPYYVNQNGERGEKIPSDVFARIQTQETEKMNTIQMLRKGQGYVTPAGDFVKSNNNRIKRNKQGQTTIDGMTLQETQERLLKNPGINLPGELQDQGADPVRPVIDRTPKNLPTSNFPTSSSKGGLKSIEEAGETTSFGKSNAGGFNAGSNPNQFRGRASVGTGETAEAIRNWMDTPSIAPIPVSKRRNN